MSNLPIRILVILALWAPIAWCLTRPKFFKYAVGEATPSVLGAIRMLVCGRLLMMVLWEKLEYFAFIPDELKRPMGVMNLFYKLPIGFGHLLHNATALALFKIITALCLFLGMLGWRSRLTVPLGGLGAFIIAGLLRQYTYFWHQDLIALYLVGVLSMTPCGDGFSLDRLIAIAKGRIKPAANHTSPVYGWARYACWTTLAVPYLVAGLSKLRNGGLLWWNGVSLRRMVITDTLHPKYFTFDFSMHLTHLPEIFFTFLGLVTIIAEIGYVLVLIWPATRRIIPVVIGLMHIGILFLQKILFLDLIMLQLIFFDFTAIRKKIGLWLNKKWGFLEVLYDGNCRMCVRTIEILKRLDLFERLKFSDFRTQTSDKADLSSLSQEAMAAEMHVITQGRIFKGFDSYRQLSQVLPVGWLLTPFLWLPGISWIGSQAYMKIAKGRYNILACGPSCRLETSEVNVSQTSRSVIYFSNPLAIAGLASLLFTCWLYKIECFPFTSIQMYSHRSWHSKEPITFYKVYAKRESGETSNKIFDEVVGIFATNGRYRLLISNSFVDENGRKMARIFMTSCGLNYNKHTVNGQRVKQLEIQKWLASWENPDKEQQIIDRFTVDI